MNRYAILDSNNKITNIIVSDEDMSSNNTLDVTSVSPAPSPGWMYSGSSFLEPLHFNISLLTIKS